MSGDTRTEKEIERDADIGQAIAHDLFMAMNGITVGVAFNVLGGLVEHFFCAIEFKQPQHALEEFDNWVAYTRGRIEETIRGRLS
ncbi:hypothetical protein I6F35_33560 [Bradyrhizobium sp. BRP22]|uniref:hypothetical protein n=1 Tax=Bradyrhizobium sp. BRP22 TaxID=2793821 RepID=UPI001CD6EEBF|nr:hypothetical protein [Bradyrhizobium sp. BRP22]MCA1458063.1 hypothetical protein [Bradyrhizobium sp. BRP22]